jgi:hypothetical protein
MHVYINIYVYYVKKKCIPTYFFCPLNAVGVPVVDIKM